MSSIAADSWRIEALHSGLRVRPDLEDIFRPHATGYMGADGALSVPLPDGRVFWLFGDTLLGRFVDGVRVQDAMPRNTAAIQSPGPATPASIRWLFRPERNGLKPFISLTDTDEDLWFWPGTSFVIGGELFFLGYGIAAGGGPFESLSFVLKCPMMARVRDTSGDPMSWLIETTMIDGLPSDPWFCSGSTVEGDWVHLVGVHTGADKLGIHGSRSVLARVAVRDLLRDGSRASFHFWCGDKGWTPRHAECATLFAPGVTESSIYRHAASGRYFTTSYDAMEGLFMLCAADAMEGPWRGPTTIFRVPLEAGDYRTIAYTLRIHPHLSGSPDELAMSYVVNTSSLESVLARADLYFPRFVSIDIGDFVTEVTS